MCIEQPKVVKHVCFVSIIFFCEGWALDCAVTSVPTEHAHDAVEYEALYLLIAFITLGAAVLQLTTLPRFHGMPVTVAFFVFGIGLALIVEALDKSAFSDLRWLFNSYRRWVAIDPHLVLFTFLPPLLFSDAVAVDTQVASRCAKQCLLLAVPGVVIGSFSIAAFFYYIAPYGWSFTVCLMTGSILSATDPVAVVSLLKDLGASPMLTVQIQGEAMLNDGTAMVLFSLTYGMVSGEQYGTAQIASNLLKSTLGAWIFGMAVGHAFFSWIRAASDKLCHTSPLIQILLTICCAYWSYLLADGYFHISGVLSTVAAALVLAHRMWPVLVERQAMLEFWHVVETVGNVLVFSLAGMLTGQSLWNYGVLDFLWVLAVYVVVNVVRFISLLLLWPLMNACGQRIRLRDIAVMTWGGLRGMVGLALAILVKEEQAKGKLDKEDGDRILFIVGCIAALSLVINATTCPVLCDSLGITQTLEGRKILMRNVVRRADRHVKDLMEQMVTTGQMPRECQLGSVFKAVDHLSCTVNRHVFGEVKPESIRFSRHDPLSSSSSIDRRLHSHRFSNFRAHLSADSLKTSIDVDELMKQFHDSKMELINSHGQIHQLRFGTQLQEINHILFTCHSIDLRQLKIVREVFLEAVRVNYWDQIEGGHFNEGAEEPHLLLNSMNIAMQRSGERLSDWSVLECSLRSNGLCAADTEKVLEEDLTWWEQNVACNGHGQLKSWLFPITRRLIEARLKKYFRKQMRDLQVVASFISAHQSAQAKIAAYFGSDERVDTGEEAIVILESQIQVFAAATLRAKISKPVRQFMTTAWEVNHLCEQYRQYIISAHEHGVLKESEAEILLEPVLHELRDVKRQQLRVDSMLVRSRQKIKRSMFQVEAAVIIQRAFRQWRLTQSWGKLKSNSSRSQLCTHSHSLSAHPSSSNPLDSIKLFYEPDGMVWSV